LCALTVQQLVQFLFTWHNRCLPVSACQNPKVCPPKQPYKVQEAPEAKKQVVFQSGIGQKKIKK
jgi:hypothetical protein